MPPGQKRCSDLQTGDQPVCCRFLIDADAVRSAIAQHGMFNIIHYDHVIDDLRVRLFVRTYGGDFDADTAARIVAWLVAPCQKD